MSEDERREPLSLGDLLALKIQQLHSEDKLRGDQPLLRIDNRDEASEAPYQFDLAKARLHRRGCRSIPKSSKTALYGIWKVGPEDQRFACPQCTPVPKKDKGVDENFATDVFYGFLSILDQFGGVLQERGREYRETHEGEKLRVDLEGLYEDFGERERDVLDIVLSSLDGILKTVRELDQSMNGNSSRNGDRPKK